MISLAGFRERAIPHTSPSWVNYSPIKAKVKSSQYLFVCVFGILRLHFPPSLQLSSSHMGLMPSAN